MLLRLLSNRIGYQRSGGFGKFSPIKSLPETLSNISSGSRARDQTLSYRDKAVRLPPSRETGYRTSGLSRSRPDRSERLEVGSLPHRVIGLQVHGTKIMPGRFFAFSALANSSALIIRGKHFEGSVAHANGHVTQLSQDTETG